MTDKANQFPLFDPWILHEVGKREWTAECAFCDFFTLRDVSALMVKAALIEHAKQFHYNPSTGMYLADKDLQAEREHRARYRSVMGHGGDIANLNRYERQMGYGT